MKAARPFEVSTFGLSPDMKRVHPGFGCIKRGAVSRTTLGEMLAGYHQLEIDWGPLASRITIQSDNGQFAVRVSGKQLTFGVEGAAPADAIPLAPEEILARLEQPPPAPTIRPPPPPPVPAWHYTLAVLLLVVGVALLIRSLRPIFVTEADVPEQLTFVADPATQKAQQQALAGMFATGRQSGDRHVMISVNGYIEVAELGPRQGLGSGGDTFRIARCGKDTCLVTPRSGIITVVDSNTLVYFGDTYRRQE